MIPSLCSLFTRRFLHSLLTRLRHPYLLHAVILTFPIDFLSEKARKPSVSLPKHSTNSESKSPLRTYHTGQFARHLSIHHVKRPVNTTINLPLQANLLRVVENGWRKKARLHPSVDRSGPH